MKPLLQEYNRRCFTVEDIPFTSYYTLPYIQAQIDLIGIRHAFLH